MDEWESVRQKIRQLQSSLLDSSTEVRSTVDSISVADFWKRRYEEEKALWQEKLAQKEQEQVKIKEQFLQDEQGIRELNFKIRQMEERLHSEKIIWEERARIKALEAELEKKKIEWDAKIRFLEEENEQLRAKIRQGADATEEESKRRKQMESEKARLEEELKTLQKQIQSVTMEEQKKIQQLEMEKTAIQKQLEELQQAKRAGKEKSEEIEKELALLTEERNRSLAQMAEREKEQFEAFENLARGFAHKVRNYLGIMSGTLQLCLSNFKMEEELKRQLSLVEENAREMLQSIEEFLSLAKIPEMALAQASINELLSNVVFTMEELAKNQNIRLSKKLSDGIPSLVLDHKLITESLKQILANAIEATPPGGEIQISSNFEPNLNRVSIRISDYGKGIPENQLKKVFQPYFTTKKGKKGLGLSVAKRGIDLHHGSLAIASQKEQGTTVTIHLPITKTS